MISRLLPLLLLLALPLAPPAPAEPVEPVEPVVSATHVVETLHDALIEAMKAGSALGYEGRAARLKPVVHGAFDVPYMAEKSLGRYWKGTSEADRLRFVEIFSRFTVANYAGRFDEYADQRFETLAEKAAPRGTILVKSRLVDPNGEDVQLNYRLHRVKDAWRIIDVLLDGTVSEVFLRRSEYSALVKREGIDALISALHGKISDLSSDAES